jgi:hypothetical protein
MEKMVTIESRSEVQALLVLDRADGCSLCQQADTVAALDALEALAAWWLSDTQRSLWRAQTLIEGRRGEVGNCSASFKLLVPGRSTPLPVFLVICQHWQGKQLPHYQLQLPHGDLGKGIEGEGLRARVEALKEQCERETRVYREKGRKSIGLQEPWPLAEWVAVQESISRLVAGLRSLDWGPG